VPEPTKSTKAEITTDAAWKTKGRRSLVVRIIVHFPLRSAMNPQPSDSMFCSFEQSTRRIVLKFGPDFPKNPSNKKTPGLLQTPGSWILCVQSCLPRKSRHKPTKPG